MKSTPKPETARSTTRLFQLRFLILAATIWHIAFTTAIFVIGRYQLLPNQFYPSGLFAPDEVAYQLHCLDLARILRNEGLLAWATSPNQLHLRLYSLPLVPFSGWKTFSILAVEPINLLYYLAILAMVFKIGERVFDYQRGLIAAIVVALWPSLLLHTTQILRDPLLIVAVLFLMLSVVESLSRQLSLRRALLLGAGSAVAVITIRIVRQPFWYLIVLAAGTAIVLLTVRAWREKRVSPGAIVFAFLLIAAVAITPRFQRYFNNQQDSKIERTIVHDQVQRLPLASQISASRTGFNTYFDENARMAPALHGSLIDTEIEIRTLGDIIRFTPRALEVGFFAPFPNMWFGVGRQLGSSGRSLAGIETFLTYMVECLALFGLWRARRQPSAWFLAVFIGSGILALGLAVNNVGALYRFRYPFWILMVILGAGGIDLLRRILLRNRPAVT